MSGYKKITEDMNTPLSFYRKTLDNAISIKSLLKRKEFIIPLQSYSGFKERSKITNPGEKILNQDRIRKTILHPVIESGTITWLFSKEKVGKTLVSLSIAYAVGKGNKPIGNWHSKEPQKVLYIDGEMPGDKIAKLCDKIMSGYGDDSGYKGRPFACYSFYEDFLDYDSILDEEWLLQYKSLLFAYDLIILDNYYSLNENRHNIKPFIKLLKEITRRDIAVIVVDHLNADDELQGSQIKRRATDLGILLKNACDNNISVELVFDRYGKANDSPKHELKKVFFSNQMQLILTKPHEPLSAETCPASLTRRDKLLVTAHRVSF